jgi:hypothetical protein
MCSELRVFTSGDSQILIRLPRPDRVFTNEAIEPVDHGECTVVAVADAAKRDVFGVFRIRIIAARVLQLPRQMVFSTIVGTCGGMFCALANGASVVH